MAAAHESESTARMHALFGSGNESYWRSTYSSAAAAASLPISGMAPNLSNCYTAYDQYSPHAAMSRYSPYSAYHSAAAAGGPHHALEH